ncbi:MAG TPA: prolyl oligopeptidase family serine peptidase [Candidatus Paceibacterota bacterium]|nr:prolyl oligopeptidase family serine peptidase [Verrucomicrobiota bacterium]HSA10746.1 prolyl oligopeptidase family serine peptidase [Candidatus Paceibacterota bacterium]
MQDTILLAVAASLLAMTAQTPAQPMMAAARPPAQTARQFRFHKTLDVKVDYLLFLPKGYDAKAEKRYPLIYFLHGAGERGTNIWKVATHGPGKYAAAHPDFPFLIVSPQCPANQVWSKDVLLGLLDEITGKYSVDTSRIYLTGLSMGGYGTWDLGLTHPDKFAAIVPICGGGQMIAVILSGRDKGPVFKTLGVWAFHGGKDAVVPLEESQRMVDALKKAGVQDVKFTVYPEAGHNSWTETYDKPELYDWLLQHQRQ